MSDQSPSSRFHVLFETALNDYEKRTRTNLIDHPLYKRLATCHDIESITTVLQEQTQAFRKFRGGDGKIMKSLKSAVHILYSLSESTVLGEGGSTRRFSPAKAVFAGFAILLGNVKDVEASYNALVDLLQSIEHFLSRLDIYTKIPPTVAMAEILVKIIVELLSTLGLATKQIKQTRPIKFMKKLFGENDIEVVLQRLDRLTQDEARVTAAQTLEVVYGLVQNMNALMDDGGASIDSIQEALQAMQLTASDMNRQKREQVQYDVRNWLSPPVPWTNHNPARESRHKGTLEWFIQGETFAKWNSSSSSSLLWVHGKPGAGKTILCSEIIENIDVSRKIGFASLAFFYFDPKNDQKQDLSGLLSSLLMQLCDQSDSYCDILSELYSEHRRGSVDLDPSVDALARCLKDMLKLPGHAPVYIVIDALDECPNTTGAPSPRGEVLNFLKELVILRVPDLRICVTSRPDDDILSVLNCLAFQSISLHDQSGQMQDVFSYVWKVVSTDPQMQKWNQEERDFVIAVLTEKPDRTFQWVSAHIDHLRRCLRGRVRLVLNKRLKAQDETDK